MKIKLILFAVLFFVSLNDYAQDKNFKNKKYSVSLGMGVGLINTPNFTEYIRNSLPISNKDSIKSFSIEFEINGSVDFKITKYFKIGLDYSYLIKGSSYSYSNIYYEYNYYIHKPALTVFYYKETSLYSFNFGIGINMSIIQLSSQEFQSSLTEFSSKGFGINLLGSFKPKLSENLSAYISGKLFTDINSSLKDKNDNILKDRHTGKEVNLNNFGAALIIGLSYNF